MINPRDNMHKTADCHVDILNRNLKYNNELSMKISREGEKI